MSFYSEEQGGLVVKEAQYKITEMHFNNTDWGGFDNDRDINEKTTVRLTLWEWNAKMNALRTDSGATFADVTAEEAKRLHLGDLLVVRVVIPGSEPD